MNHSISLPALALLFATVSPLLAQSPTPAPVNAPVPATATVPAHPPAAPAFAYQDTPSVRVDVLMVAVPEERALPLMPELRDPAKCAAAQATLLEWIGKKQARLLDWPELSLFDHQRSVSESILEHSYPIELEPPPSVPNLTPAANAKPAAVPSAENAPQPPDKALDELRANGLVPTTFETRHTGATLEAEAAFAPNQKSVSLQVSAQYVYSDREQEYPAGRTNKGEVLTIQHPIFKTAKSNVVVTLRDDERRLLYFGKPIEPGHEVILFLIGAKISPTAK